MFRIDATLDDKELADYAQLSAVIQRHGTQSNHTICTMLAPTPTQRGLAWLNMTVSTFEKLSTPQYPVHGAFRAYVSLLNIRSASHYYCKPFTLANSETPFPRTLCTPLSLSVRYLATDVLPDFELNANSEYVNLESFARDWHLNIAHKHYIPLKDLERIIVPIFLPLDHHKYQSGKVRSGHAILALIDITHQKVIYYDSFHGSLLQDGGELLSKCQQYLIALFRSLQSATSQKGKEKATLPAFLSHAPELGTFPQQLAIDNEDCFTAVLAGSEQLGRERASSDVAFTWTLSPTVVENIRRRMALSLYRFELPEFGGQQFAPWRVKMRPSILPGKQAKSSASFKAGCIVEEASNSAEAVNSCIRFTGANFCNLHRFDSQHMLIPLCLFTCLYITAEALRHNAYTEHLRLKPFSDGKVYSRFDFRLSAPANQQHPFTWTDNVEYIAADVVPRSIAALVRQHGIGEMHLSLVSGRWQHDRWGAHPANDEAPPGVELWAYLEQEARDDWKAFSHSVGGLFCASLNHMDESKHATPIHSFPSALNRTHYLKHALMASEHPCTENLSPLIALLPCRNHAGLAQLLNPHKLFDANWQKVGVHIHGMDELSVHLIVETVFDPPRIDTMYAKGKGKRDFSLLSLFGRQLESVCIAAQDSAIDLSTKLIQASDGQIQPQPIGLHKLLDNEAFFHIDVSSTASIALPLDLSVQWPSEEMLSYDPSTYWSAEVSIERVLNGFGQEKGVIGVNIRNLHESPIHGIWLEELPWWIRLYMHTLRLHLVKDGVSRVVSKPLGWFQDLRFLAGQDRKSPSVIEASFMLPANSTLRILLDFDKAYLRYTEYPPDAHRGFAVPPAIFSWKRAVDSQNSVSSAELSRTYTSTTLLYAPLPDFSMPYNVIVLTSTVMALIFGSIFNMMTRQFIAVDLNASEEMKKKVE